MEISFTPDDRGQVGIGTLIVFIAMVLVAAIAAGVLINTAGFLQTQAEDTGTESTEQVANNLNIITEVGTVADDEDEDTISEILLGVQPAAGSDDLNLEELSIQYVSDESFSNLVHVKDSDIDGEGTVFNTEAVTAEDGEDNVMTDNADRYEIVIPLDDPDPFTEELVLAGEDDPVEIVDEDTGEKIRDANLDIVVAVEDGSTDDPFDDVSEVAEELDYEEDELTVLEVDDYEDVNEDEVEVFVDPEFNPDDDDLSDTDDGELQYISQTNDADNWESAEEFEGGDTIRRIVAFDEEVDESQLEGFEEDFELDDGSGGETEYDEGLDQEFFDHLNNDNLEELVEGEEAELTFTTETGAQTVAILQVPDSLAGEDGGDTVDL